MTANAILYVLGCLDGQNEPQILAGVHWQAEAQAKAAYRLSRAIRIANPGDDTASRKAFDRELDRLETDGLVFFAGRHVGLTAEGDQQARGLAGLPTLADAVSLLAAIGRPSKGHRWEYGWISESSLCGLAPLPPRKIGMERTPAAKVAILAGFAAPLIMAGAIDWRQVPNLDGVILFRETAKTKAGDPAKWYTTIRAAKAIPRPSEYHEGWRTHFTARQQAKPARPNLIHHLDPIDPPV